VKLMRHRLDILALTVDQAWEKYCSALHLALAHKHIDDAAEFHRIAQESLDTYFRKFYEREKVST
jgi:hypothetical protein